MSGSYRHSTDRVDGVLIAECPKGCQQFELSVKMSKHPLEELISGGLDTCCHCGEQMDFITNEKPSEVLK